MDIELHILEECWGISIDCKDNIFQVEYKDYSKEHLVSMLVLLDRFWTEVHKKNLNYLIDLEVEGQMIKINGLEAKLYQFFTEGFKVKLAFCNGEPLGFIIYAVIFDCVMVVRAAFLEHDLRGEGRLRDMVKACCPKVTRVISQSYNYSDKASSTTCEEIFKDEELTTWITKVV